MIVCPSCARQFPEVTGAPSQQCPHCTHEFLMTLLPAQTPGLPRMSVPVDPVGAITTAWRVAKTDYGRFLLLWLPIPLVDLLVNAAIDAYGRSQGLPSNSALLTTGEQMEVLGIALPLSVLAYSLRLALWAFIAARTLDIILGGDRLKGWKRLLLPSLLTGFVLTLTYVAGFLLVIVGFFVFLHWFLYAPAQLAAGAPGVGAAFEASRRFARERRTFGFTALIVLLTLVALGMDLALERQPGWVGKFAPPVVGWLLGPIVPLLAASFVALSMGPPVARDATLVVLPPTLTTSHAPVRKATSCPRCATLIPYRANDEVGVVTCPSCGYTGRVL